MSSLLKLNEILIIGVQLVSNYTNYIICLLFLSQYLLIKVKIIINPNMRI